MISSLLPKTGDQTLLQHAQEFHLQADGHALDLIQEQRAALGIFNEANAALLGVGEGTCFVSEQLTVDEILRKRSAIDRHKTRLAAAAALVQSARDNFLAGPSLAMDKHSRIGASHIDDFIAQGLDGGRVADQAGSNAGTICEFRFEPPIIQNQLALIQRAAPPWKQEPPRQMGAR